MMMMPLSKSDSPQLGSEADPIRQLVFACQPMEVLVQGLKLDGRPGPFQTFADAVELAKAGRKEEAKTRLRSILGVPNLETRIQLWVWSALHELGEQPNGNSGTEILGVVIEVLMHGAYDTLAGYQDGSARYLNFSGKAIFWDKPDASIKLLCERGYRTFSLVADLERPLFRAGTANLGCLMLERTRARQRDGNTQRPLQSHAPLPERVRT